MKHTKMDQFIGIILFAIGAFLFVYFAAEFLLRLIMALIGLWCMHKGLQAFGKNPTTMAMHYWYSRKIR